MNLVAEVAPLDAQLEAGRALEGGRITTAERRADVACGRYLSRHSN